MSVSEAGLTTVSPMFCLNGAHVVRVLELKKKKEGWQCFQSCDISVVIRPADFGSF